VAAGDGLRPGSVLIGSDLAKYWVACRRCGLEIQIRRGSGAVAVAVAVMWLTYRGSAAL